MARQPTARCSNENCNHTFRLYITVVTSNCVNHDWMLFVLASQFSTNLNVATFYFTVNGFTDIVKESCTTSKGCIFTKFASHDSRRFCLGKDFNCSVIVVPDTTSDSA